MLWPFRKRRPLSPPSTPDQHDPSMPDWRDLVVAHVSPGGFVFKGSEEALRYGFQTLEEATQLLEGPRQEYVLMWRPRNGSGACRCLRRRSRRRRSATST